MGDAIIDGEVDKKAKRKNEYVLRDIMTAFALCHNVTPVYEQTDLGEVKTLQASSPDEFALVSFAESMNIKLVQRSEDFIEL